MVVGDSANLNGGLSGVGIKLSLICGGDIGLPRRGVLNGRAFLPYLRADYITVLINSNLDHDLAARWSIGIRLWQ